MLKSLATAILFFDRRVSFVCFAVNQITSMQYGRMHGVREFERTPSPVMSNKFCQVLHKCCVSPVTAVSLSISI